jgi:hypothetical protein
MHDLTCPYCDHQQDVCHDDGFGYAEDERHEVECESCGKNYVFTTAISFDFTPAKADCLNGAPHDFKMSGTIPRQYSRWQCRNCDATKRPTPEELAAHASAYASKESTQ